MVQYSIKGARILLMLAVVLFVCGCRGEVVGLGSHGTVAVSEHARLTRLHLIVVSFNGGMGSMDRFLSESVPTIQDKPAVHRLVDDSPPYRRPRATNAALAVLRRSSEYPWQNQMIWVLGTDPLIVGIGNRQGTLDGPDTLRDLYPYVSDAALKQLITNVVIFKPGTWQQLRHPDDFKDTSNIPHRFVTLPQPMAIEDVMARPDLLEYQPAAN